MAHAQCKSDGERDDSNSSPAVIAKCFTSPRTGSNAFLENCGVEREIRRGAIFNKHAASIRVIFSPIPKARRGASEKIPAQNPRGLHGVNISKKKIRYGARRFRSRPVTNGSNRREGEKLITRLAHVTLFVRDQEKAYDAYVIKLGLRVKTDMKLDNGFRWLKASSSPKRRRKNFTASKHCSKTAAAIGSR